MQWMKTTVVLASALILGACVDPYSNSDGGMTTDDGGCTTGQNRCTKNQYQECVDGRWKTTDCDKLDQTCYVGVGCKLCEAGTKYCKGQVGYECNVDGTKSTQLTTCREDQQCINAR